MFKSLVVRAGGVATVAALAAGAGSGTGSGARAARSAVGDGYGLFEVSVSSGRRWTRIRNSEITIFDLSRDRKKVAFERSQNLYTATSTGHGAREIAALGDVGPAYWSPDGKKIVFQLTGTAQGDSDRCSLSIWAVDADGANLRKVSGCATFPLSDKAQAQPWSPDSRKVAFVRVISYTGTLVGVLSTINLDGTGRREIGPPESPRDVAWAPSGRWIAYDNFVPAKRTFDMKLVRPTGGRAVTLGRGVAPSWSPTGRRMAYVALLSRRIDRLRRLRIIIVGNRIRQVHTGRQLGGLPTWSPGGKKIAYWSNSCSRCRAQIFVARANGNAERQVTRERISVFFDQIWWSRGGTTLLYVRKNALGPP